MESFWGDLGSIFTPARVLVVVKAAILLVGGFLAARIASLGVARLVESRHGAQGAMLGRRAAFWGIFGLVAFTVLHQLGFRLDVLLGAAGVLTVALGFASQTSVSNLISGLFLIAERPFVVGDAVKIDDVSGEVLSVDALAVRLRTFDNLHVRIPNESIIKSRVTTITRFPIRRMDLQVGVAYGEDIERVTEVLIEIAHRNPLCLEEPRAVVFVLGFGDSAVNLQFSVWARREDFMATRTSVLREIKERFDALGIEIPFPHLSLYAGSRTDPIPVQVVGEREKGVA